MDGARIIVIVQQTKKMICLEPGAHERHEEASNSSVFCKPSVVESHFCKLPYMENFCKLRK